MNIRVSTSRKLWHQQVRSLFAFAILVTTVSIVTGQTIFEFAPVSNNSSDVIQSQSLNSLDVLQGSNITCLGDFGIGNGTQLSLPILVGMDGHKSAAGRCLYNTPVQLLKGVLCAQPVVTSFSTMFQVQIEASNSRNVTDGALQGLAFIITTDDSTQGAGGGYLGWLNSTTNRERQGHDFAVEIDFFQDAAFGDPVGFHVGADVNNLTSQTTSLIPALQEALSTTEDNVVIVTVWIEYDGSSKNLSVTISDPQYSPGPASNKPAQPIYSVTVDLTGVFEELMFVGFSGSLNSSSSFVNYAIYEWSFNSDGPPPDYLRNSNGTLVTSGPEDQTSGVTKASPTLIAGILLPCLVIFIVLAKVIFTLLWRNARLMALAKKYQLEELEHLRRGAQSFKYHALSEATRGFSSNQLLGTGGFGSVYKGNLRLGDGENPTNVAVKRISATSRQGASEFLAEVKIIGQVLHRNLVRVLGWCHERNELLLVYDYMPNGSLDQHLYNLNKGGVEEDLLTWPRRLKIVGGVATALAYLHEECEERVVHRDVKSSNVMLDANFNARLGDFGLARFSAHEEAPPSTVVLAGTHGYLAPELAQTLKATEKTDVYSFGAVVLEVATGKRPILSKENQRHSGEILLVDWVWRLYGDGRILEAADSRLQGACDSRELITLLQIGLLCSHPDPEERPSMREVLNIWTGTKDFPFLPKTKPVESFKKRAIPPRKPEAESLEISFCTESEYDNTLILSTPDDYHSNHYDAKEPELKLTSLTPEESSVSFSASALRSRSRTSRPLRLPL